jgi:hypothetical protein
MPWQRTGVNPVVALKTHRITAGAFATAGY